MTKLTFLTRAVLTAAAALLLAIGGGPAAHAAIGTFVYTGPDGAPRRINAPINGVCYDFASPAVSTDNETDTDAVVFPDIGCRGNGETFPPRTDKSWGTLRPQSVRFG